MSAPDQSGPGAPPAGIEFEFETSARYGGSAQRATEQWRVRASDLPEAIALLQVEMQSRGAALIEIKQRGRVLWRREPGISAEEENFFDEEMGLV